MSPSAVIANDSPSAIERVLNVALTPLDLLARPLVAIGDRLPEGEGAGKRRQLAAADADVYAVRVTVDAALVAEQRLQRLPLGKGDRRSGRLLKLLSHEPFCAAVAARLAGEDEAVQRELQRRCAIADSGDECLPLRERLGLSR